MFFDICAPRVNQSDATGCVEGPGPRNGNCGEYIRQSLATYPTAYRSSSVAIVALPFYSSKRKYPQDRPNPLLVAHLPGEPLALPSHFVKSIS